MAARRFWKGAIDEDALISDVAKVEREAWTDQLRAGIDLIGIDGTLTIVPPLAPGAPPEDPAFALALEHCTIRGRTTWTYRGGGTLTIDHALCAALSVFLGPCSPLPSSLCSG